MIGFAVNPPSLGQSPRSLPIEYVIMAQVSYPELDRDVQNFIAEISKTGIALSPQSDLRLNTPELKVAVNRDKLGDVGVSVETVGRTLQTMLGGRQVTRFKKDGEQYDVIVQVAPRDRSRPNDISDIYVRGRDGTMVQLANLVDVREGVSPASLNHFYRLRSVKVTGTLAPGYTIADPLKAMVYNPDLLEKDRDSLREIYRALGYLEAEVKEFDTKIDEKDKTVEITADIQEGERTEILEVDITGVETDTREKLMEIAGLKQGDPYNEIDISDARFRILYYYTEHGYDNIDVTVTSNIEGYKASLKFNIIKGPRKFFGKTIITGK